MRVTEGVVIRDSRARALCWWLCGWLGNGILLQERRQTGEQPGFIGLLVLAAQEGAALSWMLRHPGLPVFLSPALWRV